MHTAFLGDDRIAALVALDFLICLPLEFLFHLTMSDDNINDLENFRKQWREEVLRKRAAPSRGNGSSSQTVTSKATNTQKPEQVENSVPTKSRYQDYDDGYSSRTYDFGDLEEREELRKLGPSGSGVHPESQCEKEPVSALEHYEEAVENEKQGKLGESLRFYRKAFRVSSPFWIWCR